MQIETSPTSYGFKRIEINTPFALEEKQHLVKMFGKWYSVFSYVVGGQRKFKCRKEHASSEAADMEWEAICKNYA